MHVFWDFNIGTETIISVLEVTNIQTKGRTPRDN